MSSKKSPKQTTLLEHFRRLKQENEQVFGRSLKGVEIELPDTGGLVATIPDASPETLAKLIKAQEIAGCRHQEAVESGIKIGITHIRDIADSLGAEKSKYPGSPTIWYHGGQSYSRDGIRPIRVSTEQHNILNAFLGGNEAFDTDTLSDKGVSNVTTVIVKLAKKFGDDAVRRPDDKGDGYFIRVRPLQLS